MRGRANFARPHAVPLSLPPGFAIVSFPQPLLPASIARVSPPRWNKSIKKSDILQGLFAKNRLKYAHLSLFPGKSDKLSEKALFRAQAEEKQFRPSGNRPENPQIFRFPQSFSPSMKIRRFSWGASKSFLTRGRFFPAKAHTRRRNLCALLTDMDGKCYGKRGIKNGLACAAQFVFFHGRSENHAVL